MVSMNRPSLSLNLKSHKTRFALRFIRALSRIKKDTTNLSSMETLRRRSHIIKLAADASMASAVGSRRSWSRALLFKIRNRARLHAFGRQKVVDRKKMKMTKNNNKRIEVEDDKPKGDLSRADELRRLVPGGEAMDFCSLLEETAHYIKCLNTQVQVMQSIADLYSP